MTVSDVYHGKSLGDNLDSAYASLLSGKIDAPEFARIAGQNGLNANAADDLADQATAIHARQHYNTRHLQEHYDYVIIGAGVSGSVVARRLAEDQSVNVLLLEAGGADDAPGIIDPSIWYTHPGTDLDWNYFTEPSAQVNGRSVLLSMGRIVGGGSSINASYWVHGKPHDFNFWAQQVDDQSWGWDHVLGIYKRIENFQGPFDPSYRGTGGLVWIEQPQNPNPLAQAIVEGAATIGIPGFDDNNGVMNHSPQGASLVNVRIKHGRRRNIPSDYLYPILHQENITVLTGAEVDRLTLQGKRVTGVEFSWQGQQRRITSEREVILSAGALNTPKLLLLSGIGPAPDLQALGIELTHHLPGVGQNLQDHPVVAGCVWEHYSPHAPRNNICEATFFAKSDLSLEHPDLQPFLAEVPYASEENARLATLPEHGWSLGPGLNITKSRGSVKLRSANPRDKLLIDTPFLKHPDDFRALLRGVEICREIGNSAPLKPFAKREVLPGPLKGKELEDFVRNGTITYRHEVGTSRMGLDELAVVDGDLKVHGIDGLRIADGSIMPRITTGNPMAPCVIIGERLAEILKKNRNGE